MKNITIGSFNLRNHYWDKNWDGNNFPKDLSLFITQNNIDFLGTQEMTKKYANKLQLELGKDYTISGEYRYGKIPFIDQFNESNAIITNQPIIKTETKYLATIPFLDHLTQMPRIMTSVITPEHTIINTHLEYWNEYAQKYQLKILYRYIKKCIKKHQTPIITGDFNMDLSKDYFLEFINKLEKLGIQYINNNTATYATKEQILDHVFVPIDYEVTDVEVIKNQLINQISDHRPLLVKLKKRS